MQFIERSALNPRGEHPQELADVLIAQADILDVVGDAEVLELEEVRQVPDGELEGGVHLADAPLRDEHERQ